MTKYGVLLVAMLCVNPVIGEETLLDKIGGSSMVIDQIDGMEIEGFAGTLVAPDPGLKFALANLPEGETEGRVMVDVQAAAEAMANKKAIDDQPRSLWATMKAYPKTSIGIGAIIAALIADNNGAFDGGSGNDSQVGKDSDEGACAQAAATAPVICIIVKGDYNEFNFPRDSHNHSGP